MSSSSSRSIPHDYIYVPNSTLVADMTYVLSLGAYHFKPADYELFKSTLSSLLTSPVKDSLPFLSIIQSPILYDLKGKPKRPKKVLVGIELNPGPGQSPSSLLKGALTTSAIASLVKDAVTKAVKKKKVKVRKLPNNNQGFLVPYNNNNQSNSVTLGHSHMTRMSAPVSTVSTYAGSAVRMSALQRTGDGLRMAIRGFAADIGIAPSSSFTSTVNFLNYYWSTGYYATNLGYWNIPWDPNNMTAVLSNIGGCYQKFRIVKALWRYHGGCATSTTGQIGLFTTMDPAAAINFSTNPSATGSTLNQIRTSPATKMFPPWSPHVEQEITPYLDTSWKYVYDTSATNTDDLRLSVAGNTTVVAMGLPSQTGGTQFFGTVELDLVVDFIDMINPTVT